MTVGELWPSLTLVLLGAYHGVNPAMGWLFAVARGLQEKRRSAVLQALAPIALGHAASLIVVIALVGGAQMVVGLDVLRPVAAGALVLFGVYKLARPGWHPRWVGMKVGLPELALWSFLMATADGAGLMLFPVVLGSASSHAGHAADTGAAGMMDMGTAGLFFGQGAAAVLVHTLGMLVVMAAVAVAVYEWLGVAILRQAWFNLHRLWAVALVTAGVITLFT
jgi:hypothetical protein